MILTGPLDAPWNERPGARYMGGGRCAFAVWAPVAGTMELVITKPTPARLPMLRDGWGWFRVTAGNVHPGSRYFYALNGKDQLPDPASRLQEQGVHGPSTVIGQAAFGWSDADYTPPDFKEYVLYEMHVGAFTPEGTFFTAAGKLDYLADLGVTAVSLMPVAQFSGRRNWGYDGVYPYAVQDTYGGPPGLKAFVDAAHARNMAVVLDVVYNHLGPEGNHLAQFGPYFTDNCTTPWGPALNFDGPWSDFVRNHFIQNALMWYEEYHLDGLRLDAVHAIHDHSARPFLAELAERTDALSQKLGRSLCLIAESDLNDAKIVMPREKGGHGLRAQWCDDFHHALHALLTGERQGYYADFGNVAQLAKAFAQGYVLDGGWSDFRKRRHGNDSGGLPADRFVFYTQSHDQAGNRVRGERLSSLVPPEALRLAAAVMLLAPGLPMLFMGEEWAETAPFLYFTDFADERLARAVKRGRNAEYKAFGWRGRPLDPQFQETFMRSKLNWPLKGKPPHAGIFELYKALIAMRKAVPALAAVTRQGLRANYDENGKTMAAVRPHPRGDVLLLFNFSAQDNGIEIQEGAWKTILDVHSPEFGGAGSGLPAHVRQGERVTLPAYGAAVLVEIEP